MPLKSGHSEKTIGENIRELHHGPQYAKTKANHGAGVANKQAIAVAENVARRAKERASGGRAAAEAVLPANHQLGMRVPKGGSMCHNCEFLADPSHCGNEGFIKWNGEAKLPHPSDEYCCDLWNHAAKARASGGKVKVGPIRGNTPGRTDVHPAKVADGSYILSADVISHLGHSNTDAGLKVANHLFGVGGVYDSDRERSKGGKTGESLKPVDCILAPGEFAISPQVVRKIGHGDIDAGHKYLDHMSMLIRQDHISTLQRLPPPAKD